MDLSALSAGQDFGFHQFGRFILFGSDASQHLDCLSAGGKIENRFDCSGIFLRQIGNLRTDMDQHQVAFFAQDSWRVAPRLTLNYGLRWEAQFNPEPQTSNTELLGRVQGVQLPLGRTDPAIIPDSKDQVMPRIGIAYRPFSDSTPHCHSWEFRHLSCRHSVAATL